MKQSICKHVLSNFRRAYKKGYLQLLKYEPTDTEFSDFICKINSLSDIHLLSTFEKKNNEPVSFLLFMKLTRDSIPFMLSPASTQIRELEQADLIALLRKFTQQQKEVYYVANAFTLPEYRGKHYASISYTKMLSYMPTNIVLLFRTRVGSQMQKYGSKHQGIATNIKHIYVTGSDTLEGTFVTMIPKWIDIQIFKLIGILRNISHRKQSIEVTECIINN